jgi:hypothetical protein
MSEFASYPDPTAMEQIVKDSGDETKLPHQNVIHELEEAGAALAVVAAATVSAAEIIARTSKRTRDRTSSILGNYADAVGTPHSMGVQTSSYNHPEKAAFDGQIDASIAVSNAIRYTILTETGIGDQPGIPADALAAADNLLDVAANDSGLHRMLTTIAAHSWANELQREEHETAANLTQHESAIHDSANSALQSAKERGAIHPNMFNGLTKVLGIAQHTIITAIPGGTLAEQQFKKVAAALGSSTELSEDYIAHRTQTVLTQTMGRAPLAVGDMDAVDNVLYGVSTALGPNVVPKDVSRSQLARAIATRTVLRNPDLIFSPGNVDPYERQIAVGAQLAATFDWSQDVNTSLTRAAMAAYDAQSAPDIQEDTQPRPATPATV